MEGEDGKLKVENGKLNWSSDGQLGAPLRMDIDATVVPEPSSSSLLALATGGLLFRRSRKVRVL